LKKTTKLWTKFGEQDNLEDLIGMDLVPSATSQSKFASKFRKNLDNIWMQTGEHFYFNFMQLMKKREPSIPLVPTLQIDLFWHTHMRNPIQYMADCKLYFGDILEHDDAIPEDKLKSHSEYTNALWKQEFHENYQNSPPRNSLFSVLFVFLIMMIAAGALILALVQEIVGIVILVLAAIFLIIIIRYMYLTNKGRSQYSTCGGLDSQRKVVSSCGGIETIGGCASSCGGFNGHHAFGGSHVGPSDQISTCAASHQASSCGASSHHHASSCGASSHHHASSCGASHTSSCGASHTSSCGASNG